MKFRFTRLNEHSHYSICFDGNGAPYNTNSRMIVLLDEDGNDIEFPKDDNGKILK